MKAYTRLVFEEKYPDTTNRSPVHRIVMEEEDWGYQWAD